MRKASEANKPERLPAIKVTVDQEPCGNDNRLISALYGSLSPYTPATATFSNNMSRSVRSLKAGGDSSKLLSQTQHPGGRRHAPPRDEDWFLNGITTTPKSTG